MQGEPAAPPASTKKKSEQTDAQWQYKPEDEVAAAANPGQDELTQDLPEVDANEAQEVSWAASEFIAHSKGVGWYGLLTLGTALLVTAVYFLTHDFVSIIAVFIMAAVVGITAGRKPRVIEYRLDGGGLSIGQKFYSYEEFRSFAVVDEGVVSSIMFAPLKRFMPPLTIYYDPEDEERIIDVLAKYLPLQQQPPDVIDRFARRIRF